MTDIDPRLRTELGHRAEQIDVTGDFAARAIELDRRNQRRRATAGALGAAVALAVTAPFVYSAMGPTHAPVVPAVSSSAPAPTATTDAPVPTTAAPTPSTSEAPEPAVATPSVTYALDDTIRFGNKVIRLEKGTVVENLAVLANGGFVLQSHLSKGVSSSEMELLSPEGRTIKALGPAGFYVVSRDGERVLAKSGLSDTLLVLAPDGAIVAQRTDSREPAAIVGDMAYLNGPDSSLEWNVRTGATRTLPGHLVAVSDDRAKAALQWEQDSAIGMAPGCWAVVDLTAPTFPKLIERCGEKENPMHFMPGAFSSSGTYLVGSNFVDGGYWFSAAVVRVDDGTMVVGDKHAASGWTWRLEDDETLRISRNTSNPTSPATRNTLQTCTLALECTDLAQELPLNEAETPPAARYVVPK